jgi:glycosyltransferase involved in cell wall biosynthesis
MKILYSSSVDITRPNGPGVNEFQFVSTALTLRDVEFYFVIPEPEYSVSVKFPADRMCYVPSHRRRSPLQLVKHLFYRYIAIRKILKKHHIDGIVFRSDVFPIVDYLIAASGKIPVWFKTFGNGAYSVIDSKAWPIRMLKPLNQWLVGKVLQYAKGVDVVSDIHADMLRRNYSIPPKKVVVLDNKVDTNIFTPINKNEARNRLGLPLNVPIIGYVGNFANKRGGMELVTIISTLLSRGLDCYGVIVSGDGHGIDQLRILAQRKDVADRVRFEIGVPVTGVPTWMSAMTIGVSFRENDGCSELKVRQYVACGIPVIASALVNSFLQEHDIGSVVERTDEQATADAAELWINRMAEESGSVSSRIRQYAVDNLSIESDVRYRVDALAGTGNYPMVVDQKC